MIKEEQKLLDFIEMTDSLIKKNTDPKGVRETVRLYVKSLEKVNLKSLRHELEKDGFRFKNNLLQNGDRKYELWEYYSNAYNETNEKYLIDKSNRIGAILNIYITCIEKAMNLKSNIINWCDDTYKSLMSKEYDNSITYSIKFIGHIRTDIENAYNEYVLDTEKENKNIQHDNINTNSDELKFFKFGVRASDLIPRQIKLKDSKNVAICDVEVKPNTYNWVKSDKDIEITVVTPESNVISGYGINNNASCDKIYQDYITVDLSFPSEEIIKLLKSAKESGKNISLK